jgi:hypothetical protein
MEPLDGLFGGRQVIDTVGLLENGFGSLGWVSGSPVVTVLGERDTIPTVVVANPYQDGFTLAWTVTPSFVKMEMVPSSASLPTLMRE